MLDDGSEGGQNLRDLDEGEMVPECMEPWLVKNPYGSPEYFAEFGDEKDESVG